MRTVQADRSVAALAVAIACWSFSPYLIVKAAGLAPSAVVAMYAVVLGSMVALAVTARSRRLNVFELVRVNREWKTLHLAALLGVGAFVAYPLLYFSAIQISGKPALVNLVNYLWPILGLLGVLAFRRERRSLEVALAVAFGFAGAALAILSRGDAGSADGPERLLPFVLAAVGAVVYGGVSALSGLAAFGPRQDRMRVLVLALLIGGAVDLCILVGVAIVNVDHVVPTVTAPRVAALLTYALFLPVAHLSWLSAITNPRVPGFASAFIVPVLATAVLAIGVGDQASPELLSALVLVLCGIGFSASGDHAVPVGFAVSLGFLASVQVSQALAGRIQGPVDAQTGLLAEIMSALVAIFGGFVLSNAIRRHDDLQGCCTGFYSRAAELREESEEGALLTELDAFDNVVLTSSRGLSVDPALAGGPVAPKFAAEWSRIDLGLSNKVSNYEWLVLFMGTAGLIFAVHVFAISSRSVATIALRAFATAVSVGVLFAVRDYDRHRPRRIVGVLSALRRRYGFPVSLESPLTEAQRSMDRRLTGWQVVGLAVLVGLALVAVVVNAL